MTKYSTKIKALKESGSLNPHPEQVKAPLFQNSSFFDPHDLLQVKYEMLRCVVVDGISKTKATELFGVSRPTFYEAEASFIQGSLNGLLPQQRGPKEAHKLGTRVMAFIDRCNNKNPKLQSKELVKLIQTHFNISVHPRSIERAIARKKKLHQKDR